MFRLVFHAQDIATPLVYVSALGWLGGLDGLSGVGGGWMEWAGLVEWVGWVEWAGWVEWGGVVGRHHLNKLARRRERKRERKGSGAKRRQATTKGYISAGDCIQLQGVDEVTLFLSAGASPALK